MEDKLFGIYKGILGGFVRVAIFGFLLMLVIGAFWFGFIYGFAQCFGQTTCSSLAQMAFLILPATVIYLAVWLYRRWRKHQAGRYHEAVKTEVLKELGTSQVSKAEQMIDSVVKLLNNYEFLTIEDVAVKTAFPMEEVLSTIRELLSQRKIRQETGPDGKTRIVLNRNQP